MESLANESKRLFFDHKKVYHGKAVEDKKFTPCIICRSLRRTYLRNSVCLSEAVTK